MSLSLYVHIPFCKSKCPYCSFLSYENRQEAIVPYLEALGKEAAFYKGQSVSTIYIGGGTPTYLSETELGILFDTIRSNFKIDNVVEWTIEANPATFDLCKAKLLRSFGVTRVSLGIQSFQEKYLQFLARPYGTQDALRAYAFLREAGFDNISVDLMYAFSGQTEEELASDVQEALKLNSEHISLYTLSVSEESVFYQDNIEPLDNDQQVLYYGHIRDWLSKQGFLQYEVSSFSKKNYESRHNLNYWQGGDYIGLGLGAHAHLGGVRFWNTSDLVCYGALLEKGIMPKEGEESLPVEQKMLETLLIGLRLVDGVDVEKLEERFHLKLGNDKRALIDGFVREGLLKWEDGYLKTALSGILLLDEICAKII
ncbi:MAG: radical SAM family heme chaperone HemW [Candidatus Omnitrophota bacterium]